MSDALKVSPAGGAMLVGRDENGNQTATFFAEGLELPEVGTPVYNDGGTQVSYFCSRGWMPVPLDPALLKFEPILVPFAEFDPFHLYELQERF